MQDQLTEAISGAIRSAMSPAAAGPQAPQRAGGRRLLAAMIAARDSDCECEASQLLREELDDAIGDLLKGAPVHAGSTNNQPAARPANRRERRS